jgi:hypothetical protein
MYYVNKRWREEAAHRLQLYRPKKEDSPHPKEVGKVSTHAGRWVDGMTGFMKNLFTYLLFFQGYRKQGHQLRMRMG